MRDEPIAASGILSDDAIVAYLRDRAAVERSGVAVDRIFRDGGGIYVQLTDNSWQYNWEYVYLPDPGPPPATNWPGETWTHIGGRWWFHRAHDD